MSKPGSGWITSLLNRAKPQSKTASCLLQAITPTSPPIISAVLQGDLSTLSNLLERGEFVDEIDSFGFTASHWAACHPRADLLDLLLSYKADWSLKIPAGANVASLLESRIIYFPKQVAATREGHCLSADEYHLRFMSRFMPYPWYSARALLAMRRYSSLAPNWYKNPLRQTLQRRLELCLGSGALERPPVYLQKMRLKDDRSPLPHHLRGQWEARASRFIKAGEPVVLYSGKVYDQLWMVYEGEPSDRTIHVGDWPVPLCVDAKGADSMCGFINHGPPKLGTITLSNKGLPVVLLFALKDLDKDEMLTYSYDDSGLWFDAQGIVVEELAPMEIQLFLNKTEQLTQISSMIHDEQVVSYEFPFGLSKHRSVHSCDVELLIEAQWHTQMLEYLLHAKRWEAWSKKRFVFPAIVEALLETMS